MSSSFTDQPAPRDPRKEEGYTPTPPPPGSGRGGDDVEPGSPRPKLGSLAQKARGKKLKQARTVLIIAGVMLVLSAIFDLSMFHTYFQKSVDYEIRKQGGPGMVQIDPVALKKAEDTGFMIACLIDGAFILVGIVFFVLAALVYRYPVPVTITGLALFLFALLAGFGIVSLSGEPEAVAQYLVSGWLLRLIVIIGLASSIQSALAYERERRSQEEYGFSG